MDVVFYFLLYINRLRFREVRMGAKIWCNMDWAKLFRLLLKSDNCEVGKTGSSNGFNSTREAI